MLLLLLQASTLDTVRTMSPTPIGTTNSNFNGGVIAALIICIALLFVLVFRLGRRKGYAKVTHGTVETAPVKEPFVKSDVPVTLTSSPSNSLSPEKSKQANDGQVQVPTPTQPNTGTTPLTNLQPKPPKVEPVVPKTPVLQPVPVQPEAKPVIRQPEEERSTEKYIGYNPINIFAQTEPLNFPYVIMPKPNCVIKFPKKGRAGRKGYKEEAFMEFVTRYFRSRFQVFDDRYITVKNSSSPFEPDFTLIDEKEGKNIFIDIEIDEPYEGSNDIATRKATHFQCTDTNRNNAFKNRGWIVIRFAEIQVHQNPNACCRFVADVIRSINPNYSIPETLLNVATLTPVKQWTKEEADIWSQQKYREKYLGIDRFGVVVTTDSKVEVETALDKKVEEKVEDDELIPTLAKSKSSMPLSTAGIITAALNSGQYLSFSYRGNKTIVKPHGITANRLTCFCYVKNKDVTYDIAQMNDINPKSSYFTLRLTGPTIGLDKISNAVNTAISYHKHLRMKYTRSSWTNMTVDRETGELVMNKIEAEESIRTINNIQLSVDALSEKEISHYRLDSNYVTAYCNRREEKRTFRFDRIGEIEILDI